jgi:hypothetical protein
MNIIESLLFILKNPYLKKGYEHLSKECIENNRQNEAHALEKLINDNDAHFDEK